VSASIHIGRYRWIGLAGILMLALPLLAACGGDDDAASEAPQQPAAGETAASDSVAQDSGAVQVDLAPEIGSIDNWYNGAGTSLAELRGSPVLLVFWADY
jgi:hypothetical protein